MADMVATVVGFELATTKYDRDTKQTVPGTPVIWVKLHMPDGSYKRVAQYVSEKSMASGWPAKILGGQGLDSLLATMSLLGKQVAVWEKPSDNPQYPNPKLEFSKNPPSAAPPSFPPQSAGPGANGAPQMGAPMQAPPSAAQQPYPQQGAAQELPGLPPQDEPNPFNETY